MTKIGFLQFAPYNRARDNINLILKSLSTTSNALIALPEFFLGYYRTHSVYTSNNLLTTLSPLINLTKVNNLGIFGSIPFKCGSHLYNRGIYIVNGKLEGSYDKRFFFPGEKFMPGKKINCNFRYNSLAFLPQICLDVIDPLPANYATRKHGIDVMLISGGISVDYLLNISATRAMENQIFTIFANRACSKHENLKFFGNSTIFFPDGRRISVGRYETQLKIIDIDHQMTELMLKQRRRLGILPR